MYRFDMVGKLNIVKDTDKNKGYEEKTFESGFNMRTLRLNMKSGKDKFNVEIRGGINGTESTAEVYSMVKKDKCYENVKFKFKDREKYISDLAEFKKFVFVHGEDRNEFVTAYELAGFMNCILKNEVYQDVKFKISGEVELSQYEDKNTHEQRVAKRYLINRIYVVDESTEETATAQVDILIDDNAISDTLIDDDILMINGYVEQYDGKKKGNIGIQQVFEYSLSGKGDKKDKIVGKMKDLMKVEDEETLSKIGFNLELWNRSEDIEFSLDMVSDEEKELLELGLTTEEELKRSYGNGKGNYIQKNLIKTIKKGFMGGCIPTSITLTDLLSVPEEPKVDLENIGTIDDEDMDDLFA